MEFDVATIISIVISAVALIFGGIWLKAKGKLSQIKNLFSEVSDLVTTAVDAVGDDKLSEDEIASIKKEAKDVISAFKALIGK